MKNTMKKIYEDAFGRDEIFFETLYSKAKKCCKVLIKDKRVVSFFFLLPVELRKSDKCQKAYYLFAAATDEQYRNKGYMSELIKKELEKSDYPVILKPANASLVSYYKKFGFRETIATHNENKNLFILPINEFDDLSPEKDELSGEFTICLFGETNFDISGISFEYTME